MNEHTLSIRNLLNGDIVRLRYVNRFSTCRLTKPETVAEHSFYTTLYALFITEWVLMYSEDTDFKRVGKAERTRILSEVLSKSLLHDVEECFTGDLPRPFKLAAKAQSPEAANALDDLSGLAAERVLHDVLQTEASTAYMMRLWRDAKGVGFCSRIVEFADFLSAASYIMQEIKGNNSSMKEHGHELSSYLSKFENDDEFSFLEPLVASCRVVIDEMFDEETQAHSPVFHQRPKSREESS